MGGDEAGRRNFLFFCVGAVRNFGRSNRDTVERVGAGGTPLCCRRNRVSAMRSGTFWTGQNPSTASWARLPSGLVALHFLCLAGGWWSVGWNGRYVPNLPRLLEPSHWISISGVTAMTRVLPHCIASLMVGKHLSHTLAPCGSRKDGE